MRGHNSSASEGKGDKILHKVSEGRGHRIARKGGKRGQNSSPRRGEGTHTRGEGTSIIQQVRGEKTKYYTDEGREGGI